jgi:hypothetical protein
MDTLIFVDWDNTLFPTHWYFANGYDKWNHEIILYNCKKLDELIYTVLNHMSTYGKVVIVSNASIDWVRHSLKIFPKSEAYINMNIKVLSAYSMYNNIKNIYKWKELTFKAEFLSYFLGKYKNQHIISIGDSDYEHFALNSLRNWDRLTPIIKPIVYKRIAKTIQFKCDPSYIELRSQLEKLLHNFKYYFNYMGDFDTNINKNNMV